MNKKIVNQYDYVLITTERNERYLQIGQVIGYDSDDDGDIKWYFVKFGDGETVTFKYDLPEICKVLILK